MSNLMTVATHGIARLVGRPDPLPTRHARFVGVATLTTSRPDFRGPYTRPLRADLLIDERGRVTVASVDLGPVKVGSVTCTVSQLPRTGVGTYVGGVLHVTIGLHVGIGALRGAQDSEIMLELTTQPNGSRATADGRLSLAATATFQNGYLGGRLATVVLDGAISPDAGGVRGDRGL